MFAFSLMKGDVYMFDVSKELLIGLIGCVPVFCAFTLICNLICDLLFDRK